jgi:hypothetical protein
MLQTALSVRELIAGLILEGFQAIPPLTLARDRRPELYIYLHEIPFKLSSLHQVRSSSAFCITNQTMKFWSFSVAVQAGLSLFVSSALATPVEQSTAIKPAFFLAGDSTTAINGGKSLRV